MILESSSRTAKFQRLVLALASLGLCTSLRAATNIDVSNTVVTLSVKRLGINIGANWFYDTPLLKNLAARNPGFEGLLFQSVIHCSSGSATGCTDDVLGSAWPTGFWNGASYEVIWGAGSGRTGTIASSTAGGSSAGTTFVFEGPGTPVAAGTYMAVRKTESGGALIGWSIDASGGATVSTELADLPPGTEGRQAARINAAGTGQMAGLSTVFDSLSGQTFLQFRGSYRITFKAKGTGGGNAVNVSLRRLGGTGTTLLDQNVSLTGSWSNYSVDFTANESGTSIGSVELRFTATSSGVLLDDVGLTQTNGDSTNTTAFRDPVVNALLSYRPGILRFLTDQFGDSLDNQIAPPLGRRRSGYGAFDRFGDEIQYGLHEFLELCERVDAEPWYVFSVNYSTQEMRNLIEYLAGPSGTPYGARRAARGRSVPWTDAFRRIHLEFGNEAWNDVFAGATISDSTAYGNRGGEVFGAARSSPYFNAAKFDLVLGGQASYVGRNESIHQASSNNDTLSVAPYIALQVDSFANNEQLFGPLFAEPEMLARTGYMRQNYDFLRTSSRPVPLAVYEVNLHTTGGAISQAALDSFTPSLGAGIAVADHMLMMLRDLGIRDQMLFTLHQFSYQRADGKDVRLWGATRDMGVTDRKRPQFLAVKLANEALAGDLVRTTHSGDDPTWNQPLMNGVQLSNAHKLQSYAFMSGTTKSVIVFNLDRTSPLSVTFSGVNAPRGNVTLKRLTSSAITDNNEDTERVVTTTQMLSSFDPAQPVSLPPYSMSLFQWQSAPVGARLYTLTPCRVVDTRNPNGSYGGPPLAAGTDRTFVFAGQCGIPSTARAIALNIAVTQPTGPGFLTLYPGGTSLPLTSTINYSVGQTRANNAVAPLGAFGSLTLRCGQGSGTAHAVIDVNGYFQ